MTARIATITKKAATAAQATMVIALCLGTGFAVQFVVTTIGLQSL